MCLQVANIQLCDYATMPCPAVNASSEMLMILMRHFSACAWEQGQAIQAVTSAPVSLAEMQWGSLGRRLTGLELQLQAR